MSVEASPPPSSTKPAASNEASATKGKTRSGTDSKAGGSDAFSSLMMSLGEGDSSSVTSDGLQAKADKDGMGTTQSGAENLAAGVMLPQDGASKANELLAGQPFASAQNNAQGKFGLGKTDATQDGLTNSNLAGLALNAGDGVDGAGVSLADQAKRAIKGAASSKSLAQASSENPLQATSSATGKEVRDLKAELKTNLQMDATSVGKVTPEMLAASLLSDKDKHPAEALVEKFSVKSMSPGGDGVWGQQGLSSTQRVDAPAASDATTAYTPEMQVAEKVNYWISQDVQRAELKLDGLGHDPVEVSISMQGKEAMVEFRTDQAETRQVLEGSVAHLKDLLKGEGLVLSDVSVGSSGQNGSGAHERRERKGYRQAEVVAAEVKRMESMDRPARTAGRSIDLFV